MSGRDQVRLMQGFVPAMKAAASCAEPGQRPVRVEVVVAVSGEILSAQVKDGDVIAPVATCVEEKFRALQVPLVDATEPRTARVLVRFGNVSAD